uniref:Uncharacterized protein n=1 Tax=Rhizophagus irregularis (strain DAOM 181602 / DAOM 197198 / MUCL 43194) TaxID=747089 RepID=U9UN61_RHIID
MYFNQQILVSSNDSIIMGNPFIISTGNYKFIEIYLNNLNSDLKSKLKEYKINYNLLPSKTIFNYHNFIKSLDTRKIKSSTVKWTNNIIRTLKLDLFNDIDLKTDFIGLIQTSLFKMFIENEVIIHTLSIEISNYDFYQNEMFEIILQNQNFIHNIGNLKLYIDDTFDYSYFDNYKDIYILKIIYYK